MRSYPVDRSPYVGVTPYAGVDEIDQEAGEVLTVLHNLDTDNFSAEVLGSNKLAIGACGEFFFAEISATSTFTVTDHTVSGSPYPVPDASGAPWRAEIETSDAFIEGAAMLEVTRFPHGGSTMWLGVMLDGVLIGRSGMFRGTLTAGGALGSAFSLHAPFASPVGEGRHVLEFVMVLIKAQFSTATYTVDIQSRHFYASEVSR